MPPQATVELELTGPSGKPDALNASGDPSKLLAQARINDKGWHIIGITADHLPDIGVTFTLSATYKGAS
jgi:hypothetical protein